jgi:GNAT superfamily N-acetyltransferase
VNPLLRPTATVQPPNIEIRAAQTDDADIVIDMIRQLAESQGAGKRVKATVEGFQRDAFGPRKRIEALIAERGGVPAGLVLYQEVYSTWEGECALMVNDLFVDEALRGTGVGLKLMQAIARIAMTRSCGGVQLNVVHANRNATFFDQLGFAHQDDLLSYRLGSKGLKKLLDVGR